MDSRAAQSVVRGRVKIKTANSRISVNRAGKYTVSSVVSNIPSWRSIKRIDYIEVPSMCRYSYCTKADSRVEKGSVDLYCKMPSETMLRIQCDKCSGPHLLNNRECSANLQTKSRLFSSPAGWYDAKTGLRLNQPFIQTDEIFSRSGNVSRVSFLK